MVLGGRDSEVPSRAQAWPLHAVLGRMEGVGSIARSDFVFLKGDF